MSKLNHEELSTPHGRLSISTVGAGSPAVLLIHGNSTCTTVFKHILASPLSRSHQLIAFDLPGHGSSSDAPDPSATYNMRGYASAAVSVLHHLNVKEVVVFGWSLGGHIAIEMIPLLRSDPSIKIKGIMITGTPPIPSGDPAAGFAGDSHMYAAGKEHLTEEEQDMFAHNTAGAPYEDWMHDAVVRTDGKARKLMWDGLRAGTETDQRRVLETTDVLTAVVNGADEVSINIDYMDTLKYGNLWEGKCHRLEGQGHAPFWEQPEAFQKILDRFVKDCSDA